MLISLYVITAPYTVYEYRVLAITTVGPGNFSSSREFRTIEGGTVK